MSFPRYPAYQVSDIEGGQEAPAHWSPIRLGRVVTLNPSKSEVTGVDPDSEVSFLPMEAIGERGDLDLSRTRPVSELLPSGYSYFRNGDVVFAKITPCFENGKGALIKGLSGGIGFGTTELIVLRPMRNRLIETFLDYLVRSDYFRRIGESRMYGAGGQKRVPDAYVRGYYFALPPLAEQRAIAAFLDRETAKIDGLIEEQERLIELLKEKRQAAISQAVTKGLRGDVPMRPSGIGWLGEIPRGWEIKRLKHISPSLTVGIVVNPSEYVSPEGLPYIYGADIREGAISWERSRRIDPAVSDAQAKTRLRAGDLLTVRVGAPGVTAVVPPECHGGNCASVMLIRSGGFDSRWLCYAMNARIVRCQVEVVQYGAAQEQFNISHAVNFWVPVPPGETQAQIADYLDKATRRIDDLVELANTCVDLYRERRSALISAAVTGQIDVRGLAEQKAA